MKTAEEILRNEYILNGKEGTLNIDQIIASMKRFAKLHVEAALKAAKENAYYRIDTFIYRSEELNNNILNAYPLSNIT